MERQGWGTMDNSGTPATEKQVAFVASLLQDKLDPPYLKRRPEPKTEEDRLYRERTDRSMTIELTARSLRLLLSTSATDDDRAGLMQVHEAACQWMRTLDPTALSKQNASWVIDQLKDKSLVWLWANTLTRDGAPADVAALVNETVGRTLVEHDVDSPIVRQYPLALSSQLQRIRQRRLANNS